MKSFKENWRGSCIHENAETETGERNWDEQNECKGLKTKPAEESYRKEDTQWFYSMKKEQAECQARAVCKLKAGDNTLQCDDFKSKHNTASHARESRVKPPITSMLPSTKTSAWFSRGSGMGSRTRQVLGPGSNRSAEAWGRTLVEPPATIIVPSGRTTAQWQRRDSGISSLISVHTAPSKCSQDGRMRMRYSGSWSAGGCCFGLGRSRMRYPPRTNMPLPIDTAAAAALCSFRKGRARHWLLRGEKTSTADLLRRRVRCY